MTFPVLWNDLEGGSGKTSRLVAAGSKPAAIRFSYKFYRRVQGRGFATQPE